MEKITLDFSNCKTWDDVYDEIITKCDFPEWCGKNLDALWDMLHENYVLWNEPALFTIIGSQKLPEDVYAYVFKRIKEKVFDDVTKSAPNVKFEIVSQEYLNQKGEMQGGGLLPPFLLSTAGASLCPVAYGLMIFASPVVSPLKSLRISVPPLGKVGYRGALVMGWEKHKKRGHKMCPLNFYSEKLLTKYQLIESFQLAKLLISV